MEVATMVGGAILSPLFQSLLDSLKSSDLFTYARGSKVLEEISKWRPTLETIFAVLDDAEELQMKDGVVKSLFNDLRDLAYDVEDILDELNTNASQRKFRAETETKLSKLLSCGISLSDKVRFSGDMVSKVKNISRQLGEMKTRLDLSKIIGGRNIRVNEEIIARPLPTTSLIEPKVRGREDDHKAILDMMKVEAGDEGIYVICIVGMGGVGKTTLARMVYNDESMQVDFKAWVSIGKDFDLVKVTKTLVQSEGDLDFLQLKLKEKLFGKKFLVVLDDLWSDNYDKWTCFYRPFSSGAPGSRIIITTRKKEVSLVTSTTDGYSLQGLSYGDSLSLLAHHSLDKEDFNHHTDLMEVGQEIVKRCDGLPLAIKALGGLLRGKPYCHVWKKVLQNKLWEEESSILPALKLSYYDLSPCLKRCFAYCAIFPKKYEFVRDNLVLLWLAEGFFLDLSQGYDCFDQLHARSLFQKPPKDTSNFVMHDLINDLAKSVSGEVCLNLDEEQSSREFYVNVRHSAFNSTSFDVAQRFEKFQYMKSLRTFLALPYFKEWEDGDICYISNKVLDTWIPKLKCLRVLSLCYRRVTLPKSINFLMHLRYLSLFNAEIVMLPEFVSALFNLQTLILRNCKNLRRLPGDLCNLINLQCIDLRGTTVLEEMPSHMGNLTKLHILTKFIVGSTDGRRIQELLKIPKLQGQIHIKELQNVVSVETMDCTRMKEKEKINELVLEWANNFDVPRDENEKQVFEALQPPKSLARMSVKSYGGIEFPAWFGNDSFDLTFLEICNCRNVSSLPPFGALPSLKELSLEGMSGVEVVGVEFYGIVSSSCSNVFPSLEILSFKDMGNWKIWSCFNNVEYERQIFPKLRKLRISSCPKLVGDFPKSSHSLEELVIDKCDELQHLWGSETEIDRLGYLKDLKISECSKLASLMEGEEGRFPPNLRVLEISYCHNLERLPNQLHNLKSLKTLVIFGCLKLTTIGDLPDNVKEVQIQCCDSLMRLPKGIMVDHNGNSHRGQTSSIEELFLVVVKSDSPIVLPQEVFPTSLRLLFIDGGLETQLLGSLHLENHFSNLNLLYLEGSLESFPATGLHIPTLSILRLKKCMNLRSLPCNMHSLTSLLILNLNECPKIESFPERGMPPNLSQLTLKRCGNLSSLPCNMHSLASLQILKLRKCPNIESFPETGMPPNLSTLSLRNCGMLERQPLSEWRLDRLSRLQTLSIYGGMEMVSSFPHDSLPLPTSLIFLDVVGFKNLKSISSGLQRLTSLLALRVLNSPKLQCLPKEGFPPSFGFLLIGKCPRLKKQLEKKIPYQLAHIPAVDYSSDPDRDSDTDTEYD